MQLSFFVSGVLSFGQATLFQTPSIRKVLGLGPLPTGPAAPLKPYKGTMKIAAPSPSHQAARPSAALSTAQLNSRFQAAEPPAPISKAKSLFAKMTKPIGEVAESGRLMVDKANANMDRRRARGEVEERKRYEVKRQEELKAERKEVETRRRAERAAKKAASRQNDSL